MPNETEKPKRPSKLRARARRLWDDVTGTYQLRPDELAILADACRELDVIDKLERDLDGADSMVTGSMGQPVVNPLLAEIRQHRSCAQRLLNSLKLPDDPGEQGAAVASGSSSGSRSTQARDAAGARWRRGA